MELTRCGARLGLGRNRSWLWPRCAPRLWLTLARALSSSSSMAQRWSKGERPSSFCHVPSPASALVYPVGTAQHRRTTSVTMAMSEERMIVSSLPLPTRVAHPARD